MPVEVTRLEAGVYRYQWLGHTRLDETIEALEEAIALGTEHGDNPHVQIIDMTAVKRYPLEMRGLGRIADMQKTHVLRVLVVSTSAGAQMLGRTLSRIVPVLSGLEFHKTLESAVESAREIVAQDRQKHEADRSLFDQETQE